MTKRHRADFVLRRATSEDASALLSILFDTFESTWRPNITDAAASAFLREDRPRTYVGERGLHFWVIEVAGEAVGFVDWEGDFVNALHVRASHSRMGVGRRLMDHAEAEIARAGHSSVRLETDTFNSRSQAFYAARGYREADRYPDREWSSGLTTILLVKPQVRHCSTSAETAASPLDRTQVIHFARMSGLGDGGDRGDPACAQTVPSNRPKRSAGVIEGRF
jgi:GNAT superfamily N-acetyltransferase